MYIIHHVASAEFRKILSSRNIFIRPLVLTFLATLVTPVHRPVPETHVRNARRIAATLDNIIYIIQVYCNNTTTVISFTFRARTRSAHGLTKRGLRARLAVRCVLPRSTVYS